MNELPSQNQALATVKLPNLAWENRMSASIPCQKNIPFDKTYTDARHGALARTTSSESVIIPDLDLGRSQAVECMRAVNRQPGFRAGGM